MKKKVFILQASPKFLHHLQIFKMTILKVCLEFFWNKLLEILKYYFLERDFYNRFSGIRLPEQYFQDAWNKFRKKFFGIEFSE